jgi:pyruvate ferredoxin oxidoreductase beta subunit
MGGFEKVTTERVKITAKNIPEEEYLAPGARACAGCTEILSIRLALKMLGKDTIAISPTGCMEVTTTMYPETAWRIPWIHVAFENAAAVASGVEAAIKALQRRGRIPQRKINVVAFGGDGGTVDIGFQSLSGAMERRHNLLYICTDNEAYMNTGRQRSGATPYGAATTTAPAGKYSIGKREPKKDLAMIIAAHGVPYVASASIAYPEDYMEKVKKASEIEGPKFIHVHVPCTTGWGFLSDKGIEIGRLAVEVGLWVLYEMIDGEITGVKKIKHRKPVEEYLKPQRRFRHLFKKGREENIKEIQKIADENAKRFGLDE